MMINPIPEKYRTLAGALLLFVVAFLLFANTFACPWSFDDRGVILANPDVRSFGNFLNDQYPSRPVRELTYLLDYALFGLNPIGWHFQNIFWHMVSGILLYLLVFDLQRERSLALLSGLLFLVHPLTVEVVANISHRKDSLALAFSLLAILSYLHFLRYRQKNGWNRVAFWRLSFVGLSYLIACFSKQNALLVPLICVVMEGCFFVREDRWLCRYPRLLWASGGIGTLIFGSWYLFADGRAAYLMQARFLLSKLNYYQPPSEIIYFATLCKAWAFMLIRLIWPVDLAVEYAFPVPASTGELGVLIGAVIPLALVFLAWKARQREPLVTFGIFFACAFWLPVSNLWPLTYFAADRYYYAPLAGLMMVVGVLIVRLAQKNRRLGVGISVAVLLVLAVLTWQQNKVWRNSVTLWEQAVQVSPDSAYALNALGAYVYERGEVARAFRLVERAAENPYFYEAQLNMADLYKRHGDPERAEYYYRRARNPHP
jgi:hypothetical protein